MNSFKEINQYAHLNYLHPNRMPWEDAATESELDFLSRALVGEAGQEKKLLPIYTKNWLNWQKSKCT